MADKKSEKTTPADAVKSESAAQSAPSPKKPDTSFGKLVKKDKHRLPRREKKALLKAVKSSRA